MSAMHVVHPCRQAPAPVPARTGGTEPAEEESLNIGPSNIIFFMENADINRTIFIHLSEKPTPGQSSVLTSQTHRRTNRSGVGMCVSVSLSDRLGRKQTAEQRRFNDRQTDRQLSSAPLSLCGAPVSRSAQASEKNSRSCKKNDGRRSIMNEGRRMQWTPFIMEHGRMVTSASEGTLCGVKCDAGEDPESRGAGQESIERSIIECSTLTSHCLLSGV